MAYRPLEVTLISAKDLCNVNLFSKMDVYAVAMISGDPRSKKKSPVDREGGRNPNWNATIKFNVMEFDVDRSVLQVLLRSERALGDRDIGEVHIPIRELLDGWNRAVPAGSASSNVDDKKLGPGPQFVSYQVRKQSGKGKGVLNISYKFGNMVTAPSPSPPPPQFTMDLAAAYASCPPAGYTPSDVKGTANPSEGHEPITAYPPPQGGYAYPPPPQGGYAYPPPAQGGYGYAPPPQGGYGYPPAAGYPPQQGYGYPPQQGGYGYPPQGGYGYPPQGYGYGYGAPQPVVQQQQGTNKSKLGGAGLGLGAGLLGGAVGGMILGDMVSDASSYDAGYDAGFGDGFGF